MHPKTIQFKVTTSNTNRNKRIYLNWIIGTTNNNYIWRFLRLEMMMNLKLQLINLRSVEMLQARYVSNNLFELRVVLLICAYQTWFN